MSAAADRRRARAGTPATPLASLDAQLLALGAAAEGPADDEHDPEGAALAFERQQLVAVRDRRGSGCSRSTRSCCGGSADWGRCERCAEPIGEERLTARPSPTRRVRCAALA